MRLSQPKPRAIDFSLTLLDHVRAIRKFARIPIKFAPISNVINPTFQKHRQLNDSLSYKQNAHSTNEQLSTILVIQIFLYDEPSGLRMECQIWT